MASLAVGAFPRLGSLVLSAAGNLARDRGPTTSEEVPVKARRNVVVAIMTLAFLRVGALWLSAEGAPRSPG